MTDIHIDIKTELINNARNNAIEKYDTSAIYPVGERMSFDECFTIEDELDMIIFWYDVPVPSGMTTGMVYYPTSGIQAS